MLESNSPRYARFKDLTQKQLHLVENPFYTKLSP